MKITPQVVEKRYKAMTEFYRQRNINIMAWREMYFRVKEQTFVDQDGVYIEPESDESRVILPIAQLTVDGIQELMLTKPPAISVPVTSIKGKDLIDSDHNERALLAVWTAARIHTQVRHSLWHGLCGGWGVLQTLWDPNADETKSPIVEIAHDPYNVYPCPGPRPGEWLYVINAYPRLVAEVRDEWAGKADKRTKRTKTVEDALEGLDDDDKVTYIDYWDKDVNAVAICYNSPNREGGQVTEITKFVKEPTEHQYGFLPFDIYFPCAMPFPRIGERMGVSVFYAIQELINYACDLVSRKATMLKRWQDPPLVTNTEDGRDFEPVRSESGMHIRLNLQESANYLVNPTPMPQLDTQIALVMEFIERGSMPKAMQGLYQGSVSGIAMSLLRNPVLMRIAFKQDALEETLVSVNEKILILLEKFLKKPKYLWGINEKRASVDAMIDPDKIQGYYRNEVRLSASLPSDDANTVSMLATLVQLNVMSKRTARGVAQNMLHELVPQSMPDEEKQIMSELVVNQPEMLRALALDSAREMFGDLFAALGGQGQGVVPNPLGGKGPAELAMPSQTQAPQQGGLPGGNVSPDLMQRMAQMKEENPMNPGGRNSG